MIITKAARSVLPAGLVALVTTGVTPAGADTVERQEAEGVEQGTRVVTVTVTERTFDRAGQLLDDHSWSADYLHDQLDADGLRIDRPDSRTTPPGGRTTAGAGGAACRSLDVSMWVGRDYVFGPRVTFYRYHHNKRWCWNAGAGSVDNLYWYDYFTDVDSLWYDRGQVRNESIFYPAWSGYPKSGHKSFTQRQIENCLVHCIGVDHPWADVHAFADGAYWFDLGL